jgi:hypothetical protein
MSGEMTGDGARLLAGVLWDEPSRPIDPRLVQLLIAACLVESRGESYGTYLERVFSDDPDFLTTIKQWSKEESEHGLVLATWLRRKLPQIDISTLLQNIMRA